MQKFNSIFKNQLCPIIGVIHVNALPGTPLYDNNFQKGIEKSKHEANLLKKHKFDAIIIENMHDIPYIQDKNIGPEVIASMTRLSHEVKQIAGASTPCGVQVLACGNQQAIAVAKAADLQFIRAEGFVFSHIADEGFTDACAGGLLRYRRQIDAGNVLVLTDIKKKHSSHALTEDVSLLETAHAAEFFLSDGIVLTGKATGQAADLNELSSVYGNINVPVLIGSGVDVHNVSTYFNQSNGIIIGSHLKVNGKWQNEMDIRRMVDFMDKVMELRENTLL